MKKFIKNSLYLAVAGLMILAIANVSTVSGQTQNSNEKTITSFTLDELSPPVNATIDETSKTITAFVPTGTDLTNLTPTISVSEGATVTPASEVAQDFTNPVTYTVRAQDGSTQRYTATIKTGSSEKNITSFTFDQTNPPSQGNIDQTGKRITVDVPAGTDVTNLTPTIETTQGSTVVPASGEPQDFSTPVEYTVTAEDGTSDTYTVTVNGGDGGAPAAPGWLTWGTGSIAWGLIIWIIIIGLVIYLISWLSKRRPT